MERVLGKQKTSGFVENYVNPWRDATRVAIAANMTAKVVTFKLHEVFK